MSVELPDIDQPVSYVVDNGEAVGPMPLRSIAESITGGDRRGDVFVWWIGSTEWIPFNSSAELVALLGVPAVPVADTPEIPEPPAAIEQIALEEVAVEEIVIEEVTIEPDMIEEVTIEPDVAAEPVAAVEISLADEVVDLEEIDIREDQAPSDVDVRDLHEIPVSPDPVLAQLGARLEALSSATRHSVATSQLDRAGAPAIEPAHLDVEAVIVPEESPSVIRSSTLATKFDGLVRQTVAYERLSEQSNRVSELLARACAASLTRHGYTVDRTTEMPGHHHLVFTGGVDTRRVRLDLTPAPSVGGDEAQHIFVGMSWGRMAFDIDEAVRVVHRQLPVSSRKPGTISADAELDSGSVFTRIELVWPVGDYVRADFSVDHESLEAALDATQQMLETRWYELFIPAE